MLGFYENSDEASETIADKLKDLSLMQVCRENS
jgi:hypothetical protein